jgi:hypothetical protein
MKVSTSINLGCLARMEVVFFQKYHYLNDVDRGSEQSRSGVGLASRKANGSFGD